MRITVTGASGFVGDAVCRHLQASGFAVRGVARRAREHTPWEHVRGDLLCDSTVRAALRGADVVVHAAGLAHIPPHRQVARDFNRCNAAMTDLVGRVAAETGIRLIYISSEAAATRRTPYGQSKRQAEESLERLGRDRGLWWTVVRPALLFGEGDPGNFLRLVAAVARGRAAYIDGGRARKSLTYIGNAGPAIAALVQCPGARGRIFHLADPQPYSVRHIMETIARHARVAPPRFSLPAPIARAAGWTGTRLSSLGVPFPLRLDIVDTLTRDLIVDTRPLEEETGFSPPIPFAEGVRRTIEWCRHTGLIQ